MEWLRWYHGAVSDDKWPLIARKSGQSVAVVIAVWASLLECASQHEDRGSIDNFDPESADALLGLEDGACQSVIDALSGGKRPRIVDGRIVNWSKRQPLREDGSAERAREWRERKKAEKLHDSANTNAGRTHKERGANAPGTQTNTDKIREEKTREEKNTHTQRTAGEEDPARARGEPRGECSDFSDAPGIEFQELRQFYDEHCRPEAPLAGFIEYKQLRASREWPGMSRLCDAIDANARADPAGWKNFCPGLVKFLREHWWEKKPRARASPGPAAALMPATYAQAQDFEQRNRAARIRQARERKNHGEHHDDQGAVGHAVPALPAGDIRSGPG